MAYQHIIYEKKERIAYITINRPEVMNALNPPAHEELWQIFSDFRDDPEVWVAIITGAGDRAFCAGNDLKYRSAHNKEWINYLLPPGGFGGITNHFDCLKPMIAAVNGYCVGGGFEIALACDIMIAASHARFGLPEVIVGGSAGTGAQRLPRQIPLKIAMGMLLTGRQITAEEAYRLGLVNEIVPPQDLMLCAERWAKDILRCAPLGVRSAKEKAMKGLDMTLDAAINYNYYSWEIAKNSEDHQEGAKAFVEKRPPNWKAR